MAFPDNYHLNDAPCVKKPWGIHEWSTTGHPLKHRCNLCHKSKWVADFGQQELTVQHAQIMGGKRL